MVAKELKASRSDLSVATQSYRDDNYKWATVQAYYSIFHAARALLYEKGFREKSHRGLLKALNELYPRDAVSDLTEGFEESMTLREAADYGLVYSEEGAKEALENARAFLKKSSRLLRSTKRRTAETNLLSYMHEIRKTSSSQSRGPLHQVTGNGKRL